MRERERARERERVRERERERGERVIKWFCWHTKLNVEYFFLSKSTTEYINRFFILLLMSTSKMRAGFFF